MEWLNVPIQLEITGTIRNFLNYVEPLDPHDESYEKGIQYPIALYICHESRVHTQKTFVKFQHPSRSFYVNPRVGILWAHPEIGAGKTPLYRPNDVFEALGKAYGTQLETAIKNIAITMESAHLHDAITRLAYFCGATRLKIILEANSNPLEVEPMKMVAESLFPPPSSNMPVRLGTSRRRIIKYMPAPSPDHGVLTEKTLITDEYPSQKTVLVKLRDAKFALLYSYDVCRKVYWWRINNGGGELDFSSGTY